MLTENIIGTGKGWRLIGRKLVGETHRCTIISAICTLSVDHPNDVQHRHTGSRRRHLRDAVVAMKVRLRVARRYTDIVHLRRDAEQDGT